MGIVFFFCCCLFFFFFFFFFFLLFFFSTVFVHVFICLQYPTLLLVVCFLFLSSLSLGDNAKWLDWRTISTFRIWRTKQVPLQTAQIQMRWLIMSHLIRISTVNHLFFILVWYPCLQQCCPNSRMWEFFFCFRKPGLKGLNHNRKEQKLLLTVT